MGKSLKDNINSRYVEAANKMTSRRARRKIIAYVESYDDVFFWRTVLAPFEDSTRYFEVMLPSKHALLRGKKSVLMNFIGENTGPDMIACVDADYDYLMQGATPQSQKVIWSPYVFHTYVYAIENFQCYAESLHSVAVMVTLNDHSIFDFCRFLQAYSQAIYPLLVWSVLLYRNGDYSRFTLSDLNRVIELGGFNLARPQDCLDKLRSKVNRKVHWLQQHFQGNKQEYLNLKAELRQLGVTSSNAYLYIQGHHLFDTIVVPIMNRVCNQLRTERESEINSTAIHRTQRNNELSCYENSIADVRQMLKKNMGYMACPEFKRLKEDISRFLDGEKKNIYNQDDNEQ